MQSLGPPLPRRTIMLTLQIFTSILPFLSFTVRASQVLDVFAPPIIQPNSSSVWPIGSTQIVIWSLDDVPSQITNPNGTIYLGFNESNSLNLNLSNPLVQILNLLAGNVTLIVPDVPPRDDYILNLSGDSGNISPPFAIIPATSATPASAGVLQLVLMLPQLVPTLPQFHLQRGR